MHRSGLGVVGKVLDDGEHFKWAHAGMLAEYAGDNARDMRCRETVPNHHHVTVIEPGNADIDAARSDLNNVVRSKVEFKRVVRGDGLDSDNGGEY